MIRRRQTLNLGQILVQILSSVLGSVLGSVMRSILGFALVMLIGIGAANADKSGPHIVVDLENGRILEQKNALEPWYPASVTKLMTAYVAFEDLKAGKLDMRSAVKISQNALNQPPSKMGYRVDTILTLENALKMLIVKSANDIAVAIGESVSGSEKAFVARMNSTAKRLGMTGTRFKNPHGLPARGQVTNARDMAVLTRAILKEHAAYAYLFKITAIKAGKRVLPSHNPLLEHYRGATGMKTGFICSSGFNLVGTAKRGNRHLIAVVLGARSSVKRGETIARILNKGFRGFNMLNRKTVDDVRSKGLGREPVDLRPEICSSAARAERVQEIRGYRMGEGRSALSRTKLVTKAPVIVRTGGAIKTVASGLRQAPPPKARPNVDLAALSVPEEAGDGDGVSLASDDQTQSRHIIGGYAVPTARPARPDEDDAS